MTRHPRWLLVFLATTACGSSTTRATRAPLIVSQTFMHRGFGAGPAVFTDASGHVVEERRIDPFGVAIGSHDLVARDLNPLGQRSDPATGWSDHGARWLADEAARWLTPDPAVDGPDVRLMASPWNLHPYQYADSNPTAYWDPDGREPRAVVEARAARAFSAWHETWTGFEKQALTLLEVETERLRGPNDENAVWFADAQWSFEHGDKGALGEDYRRLASAVADAQAHLAQRNDVLIHCEGRAVLGETPSLAELDEVATSSRKAGAIRDFVGVAALGALGPKPPEPLELWDIDTADLPAAPAATASPTRWMQPWMRDSDHELVIEGDWAGGTGSWFKPTPPKPQGDGN